MADDTVYRNTRKNIEHRKQRSQDALRAAQEALGTRKPAGVPEKVKKKKRKYRSIDDLLGVTKKKK